MNNASQPITPVGGTAFVDPEMILVAIPALNEARHIATTLAALMNGTPDMARVKIVVADGGSTDGTVAIVQDFARSHPNVHLIHNPERLQAAGINRVVRDCAEPGHEFLVRVDAHAHYPKGYVLAVAQSLVAHGTAALATVMDSIGTSCFQRGVAFAMTSRIGSGGSGHRGGTESGYVDHGHHAGFRLDVWREVGGYNPTFAVNEDAELDHRIGLMGGKIWLDAMIRMEYVVRGSLAKLGRQYWKYGKGRAQTVLTHRLRPRPRQMVPPAILIVNMLSIALALLFPIFLILPLLYLGLLAVVALQLLVKFRSVCALWAAPASLVMHQTWGAGFLWQLATLSRPKS